MKSSDGRYWVGKRLEAGRDRAKILGKFSKMTKARAREEVARIVKPINERATRITSRDITVKEFVRDVFLLFYRHKWKRVTDESRPDSITRHIVGTFGSRRCVP